MKLSLSVKRSQIDVQGGICTPGVNHLLSITWQETEDGTIIQATTKSNLNVWNYTKAAPFRKKFLQEDAFQECSEEVIQSDLKVASFRE